MLRYSMNSNSHARSELNRTVRSLTVVAIAVPPKYYCCMSDDVLRVVALTIACLFGLWTLLPAVGPSTTACQALTR